MPSTPLPAFEWTDPLLVGGQTLVRAVHLLELRAALAEAYERAGRAVPVFTDPAVDSGAIAKGIHIGELRDAVVALEEVQPGAMLPGTIVR